MRFQINSKKHGAQSFYANERRPGGYGTYVFLEDRGTGTTGSQICDGGGFRGNTVTCNGTPEGLEETARRWWRQYLRNERAN